MFQPVEDAEIDCEIVSQGGLYEFVKLAFPYVVALPYIDGRVVREVCLHLEAVSDGDIKRLIINLPPGFMKSLIVCVFWPTWVWATRDINYKFIFASYDQSLTLRDADRSLELMRSKWFRDRWGDLLWDEKRTAIGDIHTKTMPRTHQEIPRVVPIDATTSSQCSWLKAGWRFATSVMGKATGRHANVHGIDDPHKPQSLMTSKRELTKAQTWLDETMSTRAEDPKNLARVLIMQRLHEDDLSGYCLRRGDYVHLRLPMRFESKYVSVTPVGGDWRTEEGELLWPEKCDVEGVETLEKDLKTEQAKACQLQQRPNPKGGIIFREKWFRYWHVDGLKVLDPNGRPCLLLPIRGGVKLQSWDLKFADETSGQSRVCGQVWWDHTPYYYLLDSDVDVYGFVDSIDAIRRMSRAHPEANSKLIENKANGAAAQNTLKTELNGIELVEPEGGKLVRCFACQPIVKTGYCVLPHPDMPGFEWVRDFVAEVTGFPNALYDDQPDTMSQALNHRDDWKKKFMAAMDKAKV